MSRKTSCILIVLSLTAVVTVALWIHLLPFKPQTRHITLVARKYGYAPAKIVVNRGDTVVLKPTSLDVTHGFLLDGYPVEFTTRKDAAFLKYSWTDEDGKKQTDWDRVSEVKFVADKPGKFIFRCTQTCGNLHPFMTGELIVRPNTPYYLYVALSIWLVFSLLLYFRTDSSTRIPGFKHIDILQRWPWLKKMIRRRSFQFLVILPNFVVFYLLILSALWGSPVGNRNIAIIFVWILWWFVLKAVIVPLGGRIWCMICPLPAPAEWLSRRALTGVRYAKNPFKSLHHRFTGLQKDWPKVLDNIWLQNFLFLTLISFGMILITRPVATAFLFLGILAVTLVMALIYRRRVFCRYLCPVGGFLGTYSMASMTALRVIDPQVCKKHRKKCCYAGGTGGWACPWKQYPGRMNRNNYCGLCTECIKSCPKDNLGFYIRPFGSDRLLKGYDEMFNVIIMLVVAIAFSITMGGPWAIIKDAANITESRQIGAFLLFLAVMWGMALGVFPGLFLLAGRVANRLSGRTLSTREITLRLAYILVPMGIFAWIAFSLPMLMVNYGYILNVLSDPLGLGWNLLGTADFAVHPFYPQWIPIIQGTLLLAGLYFGLTRGYLGLKDAIPEPALRVRAMIVPAIYALLVTQILLKLYMG